MWLLQSLDAGVRRGIKLVKKALEVVITVGRRTRVFGCFAIHSDGEPVVC